MGVFIALFNVIFIDYLRNVFKNQFIEWDVKTITAGDYSVELDLPREMYDNFVKEFGENPKGKSTLEAFRDYIVETLEERLTNLPDQGYEEEPPERIKISMITFAYDNSEIINLLKARGSAIKYEDFNTMRKVNE